MDYAEKGILGFFPSLYSESFVRGIVFLQSFYWERCGRKKGVRDSLAVNLRVHCICEGDILNFYYWVKIFLFNRFFPSYLGWE